MIRTIFRKQSNVFRLNAGFQGEQPEFLHQVGARVLVATCQTPGHTWMSYSGQETTYKPTGEDTKSD